MQQQQRLGQLSCSGCQTTLGYPIGSHSVRCPMCQVITRIQQIHVVCITCRSTLALPLNTSVAMCPTCRTVMSIPSSISQETSQMRTPPKECVFIERPSLLDKNGKHITNFAVGTKQEERLP